MSTITAAAVQASMIARNPTLGAGVRALHYANLALNAHTPGNLGAVASDMLACWALHRMIMDDRESAGSNAPMTPVSSKRTMDISVSYMPTSIPIGGNEGDWNLTSYGRQYWQYVKTRAVGKPFIVMGR